MHCNADYGGLLLRDSQIWLHLISEISGTVCSFVFAGKPLDGIQMTAAFATSKERKDTHPYHSGNFPHGTPPIQHHVGFYEHPCSFILPPKISMVCCLGEWLYFILLNFLVSSAWRGTLLDVDFPSSLLWFCSNSLLTTKKTCPL